MAEILISKRSISAALKLDLGLILPFAQGENATKNIRDIYHAYGGFWPIKTPENKGFFAYRNRSIAWRFISSNHPL
ncbi:hypothetical protein [Yoonia sp. 208BN28-4]|uniref:hypothetical protein n=1 Tax=Yoonia sp. 208BN28-4 TaxID=3126505 RepID=UPI0030B74CA6